MMDNSQVYKILASGFFTSVIVKMLGNAALLAVWMVVAVTAVDNPEEMVNLLAGSFTDGDRFSTGNTLPLIGRPWGFNHWSPQTREGSRRTGSWWFKGSDHQLTWMRCTHQPSPWIGDWGWFLFSPQVGGVTRNPVHFWEPRGAVMKPYLFDATVAPYNMRIELAPTDHGAYLRVTFPTDHASGEGGERHICFAEAIWDGGSEGKNDKDGTGLFFEGRSTQVNSDRMLVSNFAMRLRAESVEATHITRHDDMKCFVYDSRTTVAHVRMATSLISPEQVLVNLRRELKPKKSFDSVALDAKMVWNKMLKRADVVDAGDVSDHSNKHLDVFYTGLYRALTFPRRLDEIDAKGNMVHYSPYDPHGGVHPGPLVTDNGFWDTFRTVYPLLSLIYPEHLGVIVQGWLNAYKEGGWLPSWASPGYRNCMVGTFADVVVADAIVKNVPNFDLKLAKDALIKDSFSDPPSYAGGSVGKSGINQYINKGYFPSSAGRGGSDEVSRTLDYGFADFSTAQAFLHLAATFSTEDPSLAQELRDKADTLHKRSVRAYTSLFDRTIGLMVPKTDGGRTVSNFQPVEWGKGYVEGNAWHHSFPPYAISGTSTSGGSSLSNSLRGAEHQQQQHVGANGALIDMYGGKAKLLQKLHELLVIPSTFRVGSYNQEIHEMTEMRALAMGQYGHNNQPSHHILYLFALLGDGETTQRTVREVMAKGYGRDFYAGDEDNGEMGAWYVLSALGLYVVTPGTLDYVLGSPVFRHVRIERSTVPYDTYYDTSYEQSVSAGSKAVAEQKYLDIFALGTGPNSVYVDQVTFNGQPLSITVDDPSLQQDGILRFIMRGEEHSNDIEQRLHTTHITTTAQLADRLRTSAISTNLQENEEDKRQFMKLEQDLQAKESMIKDLHLQIEGLKQGGKAQPVRILPLTIGATSTTIKSDSNTISIDTSSSFTGSYLFDTVLLLLVLLFVIEILDFAFYLHTNSPYKNISNGSAGNLSGVSEGPAPGAGEEDFELIAAHSGNNNSGSNLIQDVGVSKGSSGALSGSAGGNLAASLSLNDFNSPTKVPAPSLGHRSPVSSAGLVSHYLAHRRYGRGALQGILMAIYSIAQACSELYWRMYFCTTGRRPRVPEYTLDGSSSYSQITGTFVNKKARKVATHTV